MIDENKKNTQEKNDDVEMVVVQPLGDDVVDVAAMADSDNEKSNKETDGDTKPADEGNTTSEAQILKEAIHEQAREDEQPFSATFTLRKILGGDILTARLIRSQIWLIVIIVFFIVLYISNRYSVQKDLLEIDHLNTQLKDAKYKALSSSSLLTEKCRESHVLEMLKNNKDSVLKMPSQPPFIIEIPK